MDWSRDERRRLVEGSHGGTNGGEEGKIARGRKIMGMLEELYKKEWCSIMKKRAENRAVWKC